MIPQFSRDDFKVVIYYIGNLIVYLGIMMLLPLFVGIINNEINPSLDFIISSLLCLSIGNFIMYKFPYNPDINWRQGMSIVALSWIVCMFLGAIPLFLSGHYISYLDACFESMSAFATTGLVLVNDLDHMAYAYNFWRHFMCFIGGQGRVLVGLTFSVRGGAGMKVYVGEGREEKIFPNIVQTARFIWAVSIIYLFLGTLVLFFICLFHNITPGRALFHSICIFMAGWDTSGFAVQSQNILYYHSAAIDLVTTLICVLGAFNFAVHYTVWTGKIKELVKNFELKLFFGSIIVLSSIVCLGFLKHFSFLNYFSFFRLTFYHLISAHTGVGYTNSTIYHFLNYWSSFSLIGLIIAMGLGGCSCSTAGGIKIIRIGIFFKGIKKEIKRLLFPDSAVLVEKFHNIRDVFIQDNQVKYATNIIILYILFYFIGAMVGTFYDYPFLYSLFESVSACANVGLSVGITTPSMPTLLKITYILEMWFGRLEFISIFVVIGFIFSLRSPE